MGVHPQRIEFPPAVASFPERDMRISLAKLQETFSGLATITRVGDGPTAVIQVITKDRLLLLSILERAGTTQQEILPDASQRPAPAVRDATPDAPVSSCT
jgi:hypothetical protein